MQIADWTKVHEEQRRARIGLHWAALMSCHPGQPAPKFRAESAVLVFAATEGLVLGTLIG